MPAYTTRSPQHCGTARQVPVLCAVLASSQACPRPTHNPTMKEPELSREARQHHHGRRQTRPERFLPAPRFASTAAPVFPSPCFRAPRHPAGARESYDSDTRHPSLTPSLGARSALAGASTPSFFQTGSKPGTRRASIHCKRERMNPLGQQHIGQPSTDVDPWLQRTRVARLSPPWCVRRRHVRW